MHFERFHVSPPEPRNCKAIEHRSGLDSNMRPDRLHRELTGWIARELFRTARLVRAANRMAGCQSNEANRPISVGWLP